MYKKRLEALIVEKRRYELDQKITLLEKIKLIRNVPIQKIIGYIEMANVKIFLNKKVLIPRYETEELIMHANKIIREKNYSEILDLCCGSGFIGIAIKKEIKNANVTQVDIDKNAIDQTIKNIEINNVETTVIRSNMFTKLNGKKFDLIVSNPPYILNSEKKSISRSVLKFEPHHAIFANNDGLEFYEIIEENLEKFLNKNGSVILEINPLNSDWFIKKGYALIKDINGKNRFAFKTINQPLNN